MSALAPSLWGLRGGLRAGLRYGLLGLPLSFVALPLYVVLPNHYATAFGVPLATLGALLLGARLFDAVIDPWLGRCSDRWFDHSPQRVLLWGTLAALALALGFIALFFPVVRGTALLVWALAALMLTYVGYSALGVAHQSWGARLGGDALQRSRIVAWREGLGLVGVVLAAVLPTVAGLHWSTGVFCAALALGMLAWWQAPQPVLAQRPSAGGIAQASEPLWQPLLRPGFKGLLTVYLLNGIASAIPATLVLFFIQDVLQAPKQYEGAFLASFFVTAALSMPMWLRCIARWGLAPVWLGSMFLNVAVFIWAATLGRGDFAPYLLVCALSGVALGADLAVPPALLAGLVQRNGDHGRSEGGYFGWWNFATKLNLALAAGLALPALELMGYQQGVRTAQGLQALTLVYCALPCALKCIAACALYMWSKRQKLS
jgi:glycoside/pentoside/hexuronide:cation symporter, GPH family